MPKVNAPVQSIATTTTISVHFSRHNKKRSTYSISILNSVDLKSHPLSFYTIAPGK